MKRWVVDAPIRAKLIVLGLAASVCALTVASAVFLVTTYVVSRRATQQTVGIQATIDADNVSAAVAFRDQSTTIEILRALRASTSIDAACVWDEHDVLFARYQRTAADECPPTAPAIADHSLAGGVESTRRIMVGNRPVGTLYVHGNLTDVSRRLIVQAGATLAAMILGALTAMLFAANFQRVIAAPVTALATTAREVSTRGDYSIRPAPAPGRDEVGELVRAFADMLAQVERRDDDLRTANRLKDEFLATLSHELRTPLNAILGWLQVLQTTSPTPERFRHAIASLQRNARAQAQLVEDLLDVSRIVAGKLRVKLGLVDLGNIVDVAIDIVQPTADVKRIVIDKEIAAGPHLIQGDPDRLQQALWNLVSNAVKFSEPGSKVQIGLRHSPTDTIVTVRDTGIGIEPHFLPHLFEPFRQADASTTRKFPGLGLGLTIVREIAIAHGGTIQAHSEGAGRGAVFELRIPTAEGHISKPVTLGSELGEPSRILKGIAALVVDDDEDARELAAIALATCGAYVMSAASATGALDIVATRDVDVVLVDLAMPDVDGYGLLAELRAKQAATGQVTPAVAVTANASPAEELRALAAGFTGFVRKPYRFDDLVTAAAAAASHRAGTA